MRTTLKAIAYGITIGLIALTLTGCNSIKGKQSAGIPGDRPVNSQEYRDPATGQIISTSQSYEGQIAAGRGTVRDNYGSAAVSALAPKVGPEFSYVRLVRSANRQANEQRLNELKDQHKGSLEKMAAAASAGQGGAYAAAAEEAAKLGQEVVNLARELSSGPTGDQSTVITEALSSGTNHVYAITSLGDNLERGITAGHDRASFGDTRRIESTDITSPEDVQAALEAFRLYHAAKTEQERIKAETERIKAQSQAKPEPKPEPTLPGIVNDGGTSPEARARQWYPSTPFGGGNDGEENNTFLWKPGAENSALAILTPANLHVVKVTANDLTISNPSSISNGYRPTWRTSKRPGGKVTVTMHTADGRGIVVTVPDGGKRHETKVSASTEPAKPEQPASTSGIVDVDASKGVAQLSPELEKNAIRAKWVFNDDDWDAKPFLNLVKGSSGWVRADGQGFFPVQGNSGLFLNTQVGSVRPPSPFGESIQRVFFEASPEWDNIFYKVN